LRTQTHYGNFRALTQTDLQFGILHADASMTCTLEYTSKLSDREYAYLQCATLYTTGDGRRRVRCVNLAVQVASLAGNVYRFADMETVVATLAKQGGFSLPFSN
jgi:protein transport protein SEC24